jgi:hypothetical protein
VLLSLFCAPTSELWGTGATGGRTPVNAPPRSGTFGLRRRRSTMDRARPAGSPRVDPVHTFTRWKIIRKSIFKGIFQRSPRVSLKSTRSPVFCRFCTEAPQFFRNQPSICDFSVRPQNLKNIYKQIPSLRKILKTAPKLQKFISFRPQLQI